ncbi:bifunctional aminoglycoside phosphotransferase/ATP-binding protein [Neoroseomonas soli]|uniref:AAA family ATPase n=1 Tax=Neoroseomonas soli TaxID=1081025 RepID=A0A9X9WRV5_9PROT|nr:bifunctional aminoglycoside phosphotransferase/ATP-binding protein [Neoroseomonas soli]MBR0669884.1 AAA family ATPase [Neoroseomonas soli]
MIPPDQREAAALLARLSGAEPVETHVSAVFVGRDTAWKMKKAVALDFLDFTTLAAREHFCRRELELNRPHAPELYRDVVPLTRGPDGALREGGDGPAVEWALRMAPVPAGDFLDAVAAREGLAPPLLDAMADAVAAMHACAPRAETDPPAVTSSILEGNIPSARQAGLDSARVEAWAAAARVELARVAPVLAARGAAGFVRRCHGDLHLGNLCLLEGRPTPFDALEFDEALARIDVGYDLAFLLMDLDLRLGRGAANRVLNRYVARTGDTGLLAGLPLWLSLRAMIRTHVEATRGRDWQALFAAAEAHLVPAPARLVAVGGLQGTGKSTLARAIAPHLGRAPGALVLRTDEIRKRRFGVAPEERLPPEAYAEGVSAAVHGEMFAMAASALAAGQAVALDAVFLDPAHRGQAEAVARAAGLRFDGIWLEAPLEVLRARLAARTGDASDATEAVLLRAAAVDPGPMAWHRVAADEGAVIASLSALA